MNKKILLGVIMLGLVSLGGEVFAASDSATIAKSKITKKAFDNNGVLTPRIEGEKGYLTNDLRKTDGVGNDTGNAPISGKKDSDKEKGKKDKNDKEKDGSPS